MLNKNNRPVKERKGKKFKKRKDLPFKYKEDVFKLEDPESFLEKLSFIFQKSYINIEMRLYKFFLKCLRRVTRRIRFRSFSWLVTNYIFSRKSKNARMGKGKGKTVRLCYRASILKPLFSFLKVSKDRLDKFTSFLNTKSKKPFLSFVCS